MNKLFVAVGLMGAVWTAAAGSMAEAKTIGGVRVTREPMALKTYPVGAPERNPMFFTTRVYQGSCGKVYPVPFVDKVYDEPVTNTYDAITLENDYVRIVVLPEIGGRIYIGQDKTNADYDFFYRNDVIKPALVGLAGPWLSGGVEFNWPQHHRPATFMPVDVSIERASDGSATVWMSDHDPLDRLKGMHGVCLRPDSSLVELRARLYNRTGETHTFLWWANVAARVHDQYESFFPPDVTYVADHAVRAISSFPHAHDLYYGVDYTKRGAADNLAWYRNIPVPTSYMICATDYDFFGGYDHAKKGGFVHIADRHISPGKKQWTWGNHPFGYAWDRELTDESGPYVELMAGVYTDNQPDFTYLLPYETKTFSQYWWPYRDLGAVQNANTRAAVMFKDGRAGVAVSKDLKGATIAFLKGGHVLAEVQTNLTVGVPWQGTPTEGADTIVVADVKGSEVIRYAVGAPAREQPVNQSWARPGEVPPREAARVPPDPKDIASCDELFITAEHLDQYRHPTREPEMYLDEILRRDADDARAHTLYGKRLLSRGLFAEAEAHLVAAVKRETKRHPNPYTGEALYYLGRVREYLGLDDAAYPCYAKATWNAEFRTCGNYRLAVIDARRGDWETCYTHAIESTMTDQRNEQAKTLAAIAASKLGRTDEQARLLAEVLTEDPLFQWARTTTKDEQALIDVAYDWYDIGLADEAVSALAPCTSTHAAYVRAFMTKKAEDLAKACAMPADYLFPSRLQDYIVFTWADREMAGKDRNAAYALGNFTFDRKRKAEALAFWQAATKADSAFATAWRNLGVAQWNTHRDGAAARAAYEKAMACDAKDARLVAEYDQLCERCGVQPAVRRAVLESKLDLVLARDDATVQYVTILNDMGESEKALAILTGRRFHPWEGGEGKVLRQYTRAHLLLGEKALRANAADQALAHAEMSFDPPANLGEAYHLLQAKADVNYLKGRALRALGRESEARAAFQAAADEEGDFQSMAVTEFSELSYYRGLSLAALGRTDEAAALFKAMRAFAERKIKEPFRIDYFATSLPRLLIFDDDLEAVKNAEMRHLLDLVDESEKEMGVRSDK